MWTETERKMITEDGNVRRYIGSNTIDQFDLWDCADISFPNGYNKGGRVYHGYAPAITITTVRCLITKVDGVKQLGNVMPTRSRDNPNQGRVYDVDGISPALTDMQGGGRQPMIQTERNELAGLRIRKLTPLECWRLMGQSDSAYNKAAQVNSDTQLYKQAGNSIVVDTLYYLMKAVFEQNE